MTKRTMWAVGPDDGEGWVALSAPTEQDARAAYAAEHEWSFEYTCAYRVEVWDTLEKVTRLDWFRAGNGLCCTCSECDEMTCEEFDGQIVDGKILCAECKPVEAEAEDA